MTTFKNLTTILSMLFCLLFSVTASSQSVNASKNYITRNVPTTEFDAIKLMGSPKIIYTQSTNGKTSVQIYGSDNLVDLLETKVTGRTLVVRFKNKPNIISFGKNGRLQVIVSSPSIHSATLEGSGDLVLKGNIQTTDLNLKLSGSGDIKVENISANTGNIQLKGSGDISTQSCHINNLKIGLSGSGDVKIIGIKSTTASASLQGSGDMELTGTAQTAIIELNSSGDIKASGLQAKNVTATVKGSGEISCYATETLKATIKGSGDIDYKGNPKLKKSIAGSGTVSKK